MIPRAVTTCKLQIPASHDIESNALCTYTMLHEVPFNFWWDMVRHKKKRYKVPNKLLMK